MSDTSDISPATDRRKRFRVGRWLLRIFVTVAILICLLLLAVQIVLWTDLPRKWVLSAIQERLQLRVGTASFTTGWSGRTLLSDVSLSLPLADKSFVQTPRLSVEHTSLWALLLGHGLKVESIVIDRPSVLVMQAADGKWNAQEVFELLRRATGGKTAQTQPQATGVPALPKVTITDGTLRIVNRRGNQATFAPLSIKGWPEGPLVWKFDVSVPNHLHAWGEVAPGGPWAHRAQITLQNLGPIANPLVASPGVRDALNSLRATATWQGRADQRVAGRLTLQDLFVSGWNATGPLNATFAGTSADAIVTLSPAGLVVSPPTKAIPSINAGGGTLSVAPGSVTAQGLSLAFAGGEVRAAANYSFDRGAGAASVWWNQLILPAHTIHGGSLEASLRQPWPGQPVIQMTLNTDGRRGDAESWSAQISLSGAGPSWQNIDWKLETPRLVYHQGDKAIDLSDLAAKVSTRDKLLKLTGLSIPPGGLYGNLRRGSLSGNGQYDLATRKWQADIAGADWPVRRGDDKPGGRPDIDVNFHVKADGERYRTQLRELFVEGAGLQLWANGHLAHVSGWMPAELHVSLWAPPVHYTWRESGSGPDNEIDLSGKLFSELHLVGSAWPVDLDVGGVLFTDDFKVNDHPVGDAAMILEGYADAAHVRVSTNDLRLLGGKWDVILDHRYETRLAEMTRVMLDLKELPLSQVDNFVKPPPNVRGSMSGRWVVKVPDFDLKRMVLEGEYAIHKLSRVVAKEAPATREAATRPETLARITPGEKLMPLADVITGGITAENGKVTLAPVRFSYTAGRDQRSVQGQGSALLSFPIDSPRQMHVEASLASWPLMLADAKTGRTGEVILWGNTALDVDLRNLTARGPTSAHFSIAWNNQTVGNVAFDTRMAGRELRVQSISGDVLGGSVYGGGLINLEAPLQSNGRFDWKNIDAARIVNLVPALDGLEGQYSGSLSFSPTPKGQYPQALGPFGASGSIRVANGSFRAMHIGDADFNAYVDHQRAVLDHLRWNLADGHLNAWSRMTWYPSPVTAKPEPFLHINLNVQNLSLDQITRAARPKELPDEPTPGRIHADLWLAGNPLTDQGRRMSSGDGRIRITDSDLVNVDIVNALYSVLSVKLGEQEPRGRGFVIFRLEGQRLEIPVARYFNRGVDLRANLAVLDVFKGANSPIEGTAAGTARPLRDLKLPFAADMDRIFQALQQNLATVRIDGTVKKPEPRVIPFSEAGATFRRFIAGEVQEETRGTTTGN